MPRYSVTGRPSIPGVVVTSMPVPATFLCGRAVPDVLPTRAWTPSAQITRSGLGANSQAATSSSRDRRLQVVKRQTKPTTQRDVTCMLPMWLQRQKFADWVRRQWRAVIAG